MTSTRCRLFHRWERWQQAERSIIYTRGALAGTSGTMPVQIRVCERCGWTQEEEL